MYAKLVVVVSFVLQSFSRAFVYFCKTHKNGKMAWSQGSVKLFCVRFFFQKWNCTEIGRAPLIKTRINKKVLRGCQET